MGINVSVRFDNVRREAEGNVIGKVALKLTGEVLGRDIDLSLDSRNFNFQRNGEQEVYNQSFEAGVFAVKVTASVHEKAENQCCIRGHVHVDAPIGGGIGTDLDPNCTSIA